jgi:hypothetical protein
MAHRLASALMIGLWAPEAGAAQAVQRLHVFLDCEFCFEDYLRDEVDFVEYVRDPQDADVHVIVTSADNAAGGEERSISLLGLGRFKGVDQSLKSVTESGDSEDTERQRLATAITIGLLHYLSRDGVTGDLSVRATQRSGLTPPALLDDPWRNWVFSLRGSLSSEGEESSRSTSVSGAISADRITTDWKITTGVTIDYEREDFDLDEDEPLRAIRNEREVESLVARSINDHWSVGVVGDINSSTFENIDLSFAAGPTVEYNLFPYSAYTRRQLRMSYAAGPYYARYGEITLYGTASDSLARQEAAVTIEQREPWGSVEARFEASNYLPGFSRHRLELEGEVTLRLARGLSLSVEGSASRLRDQLSIPLRGATDEEVLLRLRRLQSGYEYDVQFSLTYTFGSIFNTIVNPRFGE